MYYDLSVLYNKEGGAHRERLASLAAAGYDVVALDCRPDTPGRISSADRCNTSPLDSQAVLTVLPGTKAAFNFFQSNPLVAHNNALPLGLQNSHSTRPLRQLKRLTVPITDAVAGAALSGAGSATATYDLLAVEPKSERALAQACSSLDVDIITLPLHTKLPFKLRPNTLAAALARGVVFEVCYGPGLEDPANLKWLISNTQALARCVRSKNIILSGGLEEPCSVRPPLDAACLLGSVLSLSTAAARASLSTVPAAAITHGLMRRARVAASAPVPFPIQVQGALVQAGAGPALTACAARTTTAGGAASSNSGKRRRQLQMQASKRGYQPGRALPVPDIIVLPSAAGRGG